MKSNNSVSEVSIETHTRCAGNGHVGEETHSKSRQSRDSGSGSDKITLDFLNTLHVLDVCRTEIGHAFSRADAGATSFRDNRAVDRDDVSHSEESSQTSANLREEVGALAFLRLRRVSALLTSDVISKSSCGGASTHVSRALQTEVFSNRARGDGDIGAVHQFLDTHVVQSDRRRNVRCVKQQQQDVVGVCEQSQRPRVTETRTDRISSRQSRVARRGYKNLEAHKSFPEAYRSRL